MRKPFKSIGAGVAQKSKNFEKLERIPNMRGMFGMFGMFGMWLCLLLGYREGRVFDDYLP